VVVPSTQTAPDLIQAGGGFGVGSSKLRHALTKRSRKGNSLLISLGIRELKQNNRQKLKRESTQFHEIAKFVLGEGASKFSISDFEFPIKLSVVICGAGRPCRAYCDTNAFQFEIVNSKFEISPRMAAGPCILGAPLAKFSCRATGLSASWRRITANLITLLLLINRVVRSKVSKAPFCFYPCCSFVNQTKCV
jgi:hypothetical protein